MIKIGNDKQNTCSINSNVSQRRVEMREALLELAEKKRKINFQKRRRNKRSLNQVKTGIILKNSDDTNEKLNKKNLTKKLKYTTKKKLVDEKSNKRLHRQKNTITTVNNKRYHSIVDRELDGIAENTGRLLYPTKSNVIKVLRLFNLINIDAKALEDNTTIKKSRYEIFVNNVNIEIENKFKIKHMI